MHSRWTQFESEGVDYASWVAPNHVCVQTMLWDLHLSSLPFRSDEGNKPKELICSFAKNQGDGLQAQILIWSLGLDAKLSLRYMWQPSTVLMKVWCLSSTTQDVGTASCLAEVSELRHIYIMIL